MNDELDIRVRSLYAERARPTSVAPGGYKSSEGIDELMRRLIDVIAKAILGPDHTKWEDGHDK